MPSSGALSGVIVLFDKDEDWFLNGDSPPDQIDFSSTAIHEIGHAIGINHSEQPQALMAATYSKTIFELQVDDKEAAISIYGQNDLEKLKYIVFSIQQSEGIFILLISQKEIILKITMLLRLRV